MMMEYPSLGTPPAGSIRFNTDSSKMEIYNGDKWWKIDSTSPQNRLVELVVLFAGGSNGTYVVDIQYINAEQQEMQ